MGRQLWLADALADAFRGVKGYRVETWHGWTSLGKSSFDPIGVLDHHTGGGGTYDNILRYMMETSPIAPSCNWATSPPINGVVRVTVTCAGRANHAGRGGKGRGGTPWVPTDTGNYRLLGGEHHNNGSAAWPGQQYEGVLIGSAALLRGLGADEDRAALHKTYAPGRKPDMHSIALANHQAGIRRHFATRPTQPTIVASTEDTMYPELILAAYRRTRGNTYDPRVSDPNGWRHWMENLAAADVRHGTGKAKLDVVRTCESLLAREAGL